MLVQDARVRWIEGAAIVDGFYLLRRLGDVCRRPRLGLIQIPARAGAVYLSALASLAAAISSIRGIT